MKETKRRPRHWLRRKLGAQFLAGVLIIVPIGIALLIFVWIFSAIDGFLQFPRVRTRGYLPSPLRGYRYRTRLDHAAGEGVKDAGEE